METEVLIVGAGPTGLLLANQLVRRGVRPLIIDRNSGPAQQSRAMAVQARTLEIFAQLGIADRALELGKRGTGATLWVEGERKAHIPMGDIGAGLSPYPFVLMLGQDDNERLLNAKLAEAGIAVQWNTELVGFDQGDDHVDVTLKRPDGSLQPLTTAWIAGCDGARSAVREMSGIGFPGEPYEHVFFVADTVATGPMAPGELNVYLEKEGFHLFFPMRGKDHWRVIGILPEALRGKDDLRFEEVIPHVRHEAGSALAFQDCHWFSTYRIHHRRAERFRERRCFLLGDAAHVHSPMGAQGMNTGLQDAYNLAWKLALVIKGRADAGLLDTYAEEREPVAERLLHTTDRAFMMVVKETWLARLFRTRILARVAALAMGRERFRKRAFAILSQIGIRYRKSSLSRNLASLPDGAPRAGDRFPWLRLKLRADGPVVDLFEQLDDLRYHLVVVGQPVPQEVAAGLEDLVQAHAIPDDAANRAELARAKISGPAFYLLRPDGHVGLAGRIPQSEALLSYFVDSHLRLQSKAWNAMARHVLAI